MVDSGNERGETISFERIAPVYDSTRRMSDEVCIEISREIFFEAGSKDNMLVADVGAGTGRFSVPLIMKGCRVVGIDVSREMLRIMLSKIKREWRSRLQPIVADARNLPFRPKYFDAALCFQVLHLIKNWHLAISEAQSSLRDGAPLALGETIRMGISAEINDKYKEIRGKHGYQYKRLGARNLEEVINYLKTKGWSASQTETHSWVGRMTVNSIIQGLAEKVYSGTWSLPDEAHHGVIQELRDWANRRYSNMELSREVSTEFKLAFVRSPKT